jgi:membrane protease subunit HflK
MSDLDQMKHEPPRTTEQVAAGVTPPSPPAHPNPAVIEEAGSRALADALRSSFVIVKILMVGLVVLFFFSGIFTVPSGQRAIVLRFGKPVGIGEQQLLGPGLHWSFPSPIDEVVRIPTGEILSVQSTAGWYQLTPEELASGKDNPQAGTMTLNPAVDGYTLTGDGNIIHIRATLRYRITEPLKYVLGFVNASNVVQDALDSSLFYASAFFDVTQATRLNRSGVQDMIQRHVTDLLHQDDIGITVESCFVQDIIPPRQTKQIFEQVTAAEVERRQTNDAAQAYSARILTTAQGDASAIIDSGRADATRLVQEVSAEADYFQKQLPRYKENPQFFRQHLQAEVMGRILTNVSTIFAMPEGAQTWTQLNPPPRRRAPEPPR